MIKVEDSDRGNCGYFSRAKDFDTELASKYRKSLVVLATFSLIYNFAGIEVTGTGIGIISGSIANPSVIGIALFLVLFYYLIVYLTITWVRHEEYFLKVTDLGNQNRFGESLVCYIAENKIKLLLKNKHIDLSRVQFHNYDRRGLEHKFEVHGVEKYDATTIEDISKEFGVKKIKDKNIKSEFVYTFEYKLSEDDLTYFKNHFRYLKLLHLQNFVEYRIPYILSIFAIFSFYLSI